MNDKILDVLAIPTGSDDYLFVLTKNLHCFLLSFHDEKEKVELVSKGFLRD